MTTQDFNPRSPHGERLTRLTRARWHGPISTHAPRTGSDAMVDALPVLTVHFNPRSPHGERHLYLGKHDWLKTFQPTLPARGATCPACTRRWTPDHFNPRSPHGERHNPPDDDLLAEVISTHAPRTGSDRFSNQAPGAPAISTHAPRTGSDYISFSPICQEGENFNPRSPHGERLGYAQRSPLFFKISTHAPRTGSDERPRAADAHGSHFNPRSPHGERRRKKWYRDATRTFQPTLPARGATCTAPGHPRGGDISTHAPRTGSDRLPHCLIACLAYFNPRSPHGERHVF